MQEITEKVLFDRASELLKDGTVCTVLGWKKGEFFYDTVPALFHSEEELRREFVYGDFCGCNFSKLLVKLCSMVKGKILIFLKPCDTYSFNQLLSEHRFEREKVYAIGIPCNGMLDINEIKARTSEGVIGIREENGELIVNTLYDGEKRMRREDALPDRCQHCKSKRHVAYDELLGDEGEDSEASENGRFDDVAKLEAMSPEQRYAFWQNELSRCIRCNACRDACPACTCEKCVFDNPKSGVENKAVSDSFEEKLFHIIRAFHVAGRCTDCGECSRVCPQHIPLHLLNRKFISDIDVLYGEYQAGETDSCRSPLVDYSKNDPEPGVSVKERKVNNA